MRFISSFACILFVWNAPLNLPWSFLLKSYACLALLGSLTPLALSCGRLLAFPCVGLFDCDGPKEAF